MERLNLTLDADTARALNQHARRDGRPRATVARALIREALTRREQVERTRRLANDYAEGRSDAAALLADLEGAQLALLGDDD